jgi:hypothetical protein
MWHVNGPLFLNSPFCMLKAISVMRKLRFIPFTGSSVKGNKTMQLHSERNIFICQIPYNDYFVGTIGLQI